MQVQLQDARGSCIFETCQGLRSVTEQRAAQWRAIILVWRERTVDMDGAARRRDITDRIPYSSREIVSKLMHSPWLECCEPGPTQRRDELLQKEKTKRKVEELLDV